MAGILLNRSRQVPAEDTPAFGGIAERFRRAGDLDRAIALCRDGLKKFPDQLSARVTLGWSLLDKGQYEEARAELERVLRRAPDNLAAIRGLAELHDRSEGAMPSMEDHRETWRHEEAASPAADTPAPTATVTGASGLPPAMTEDPFAPISVNFAASSSSSPEIVHTAEDAGRAAEEAAASAAAMSLPGSERVAVEGPASAAMAASLELEVTPFETGEDGPVGLDVGVSAASASGFELESAADNLLSAAAAESKRPTAFVPPDSDLAETDELVASLQQFSVDETEPAGDLVLEVANASDEAGLVDLAAFESSAAAELAPALSVSSGADEFDAPLVSGVDGLELAAPEAVEDIAPAQALETSASPDATVAAFADTGQIETLTASIADEPEAQAPIALAAEAPAMAEPATIAASETSQVGLEDEVVLAGAPLTDVAEVEPEPAFVPDLAFALGRAEEVEAGDPQLALAAAEPEFTPDLSGMALDGHGYDALEAGRPMAIEPPASDVLAHADLAAPEPEFVPDLSAVALDGSTADAVTAAAVVHEEVAEAPIPSVAAESTPAFVPDMSFAFDMTGARGAQAEDHGSAVAQVVAISQPRPGVRSLERFLRQVEARKLQLAQGSVA